MALRHFFARVNVAGASASPLSTRLGIAVVVAAFAIVQGPRVIHNLPKWHWEDGRHFHHNRQQIHSIADCFLVPSAWEGGAESTYRPLSANLYYLVGRTFFGNDVEVYHAIDAAAHLANAILLFLLCRYLLPGPFALIPPVVFVTRLAHRQDFEYTSNFDTLSYAGLCLLALLLFVRARRRERRIPEAVACFAFGLALLCKEAAVVWPALVTAYGWLFDRPSAWRKYVPGWVLAALWVVCYREMVHLLYPVGTHGFTLDFAPHHLLARYGAYFLGIFNVLVPAVDPEKAGWAIPPHLQAFAASTALVVAMAGLAAADAVLLVTARWRPTVVGPNARVIAFGLTWFFAATAPFAVLADRLFIRYTYFGHAGLAIAVGGVSAAAAHWILGRRRHTGDAPAALAAGA
ncbi:MAG TPA: hypothetical protein VFK70_06855 [Vicinamibacteria bacterium]|nr:hypothetical protein [Vicinamibacteria bacterium]